MPNPIIAQHPRDFPSFRATEISITTLGRLLYSLLRQNSVIQSSALRFSVYLKIHTNTALPSTHSSLSFLNTKFSLCLGNNGKTKILLLVFLTKTIIYVRSSIFIFRYSPFSVRDEFYVTFSKLQLTYKILKLCSVVLNIPVLVGNYLKICIVFVLYSLMYVVSEFSGKNMWIVSFVPRRIEIKYS